MMRELRLWKSYRSENDLFKFRNIEVPTEQRGDMLHYYRFIGDTTVLSITEVKSPLGGTD